VAADWDLLIRVLLYDPPDEALDIRGIRVALRDRAVRPGRPAAAPKRRRREQRRSCSGAVTGYAMPTATKRQSSAT
jgi:hypothetical protein